MKEGEGEEERWMKEGKEEEQLEDKKEVERKRSE